VGTRELLDEALASNHPWEDGLLALVGDPPADLLTVVRQRWPEVRGRRGPYGMWTHLLARVLQMVPDPAADAVLFNLLDPAHPSEAADILDAVAARRDRLGLDHVRADIPSALRHWLGHKHYKARGAALAVTALSGQTCLVPDVVDLLDDPQVGGEAALALAQMGAVDQLPALLRHLSKTRGDNRDRLVAAIGLLGQPSAVPSLLQLLAKAPKENVQELDHALRTLTGHDPVLPLVTGRNEWLRAVRQAWSRWDGTVPEPTVASIQVLDPARASGRVRRHRDADLRHRPAEDRVVMGPLGTVAVHRGAARLPHGWRRDVRHLRERDDVERDGARPGCPRVGPGP